MPKEGSEGNRILITKPPHSRVCVDRVATEFVQLYPPVARPNQSAYEHSFREGVATCVDDKAEGYTSSFYLLNTCF